MYDVITGLLKPSLTVESVSRTTAEEPNIHETKKDKKKGKTKKRNQKERRRRRTGAVVRASSTSVLVAVETETGSQLIGCPETGSRLTVGYSGTRHTVALQTLFIEAPVTISATNPTAHSWGDTSSRMTPFARMCSVAPLLGTVNI